MSEIRGNTVIEGIVKLPLVLPPVVTGHLLILLFGRNSWLGQLFQLLDIKFTFTLRGEEDL